MDIKIETVCTDGFEMEFFRFGTGEKSLVIIPGLSVQSVMNSAKSIADEYAVMAEDFTAYVFDRRKEPVEEVKEEEPTSKDGIAGVIEMLDAFCELGETLMKIEETCKKRGMTDKESEGYMGALINQAIKETIDEIKAENAEKKTEKERG